MHNTSGLEQNTEDKSPLKEYLTYISLRKKYLTCIVNSLEQNDMRFL